MTLHDARSSSRPHKAKVGFGRSRPFPGDPAGALSALSRPSAVGAAGSGFKPRGRAFLRPRRRRVRFAEKEARSSDFLAESLRAGNPPQGRVTNCQRRAFPSRSPNGPRPRRPVLQRQVAGRSRARRGALSARSEARQETGILPGALTNGATRPAGRAHRPRPARSSSAPYRARHQASIASRFAGSWWSSPAANAFQASR